MLRSAEQLGEPLRHRGDREVRVRSGEFGNERRVGHEDSIEASYAPVGVGDETERAGADRMKNPRQAASACARAEVCPPGQISPDTYRRSGVDAGANRALSPRTGSTGPASRMSPEGCLLGSPVVGNGSPHIVLRDLEDRDLDVLFEHWTDREAIRMAAFTPADPDDRGAFDARWARIRRDQTNTNRVIATEGRVVGHIASFDLEGQREVTYWIGRQ